MSATLRSATRDDIATLSAVAVDCFNETFGHMYRPEDLAAHHAAKNSVAYFTAAFDAGDSLYLVEQDGHAIGYGKLGHVEVPVKPRPAAGGVEIHRVYIRASHQGKGHGRTLLLHMLADARVQHAPVLYLGVWQENLKAQALYTQYGFKIVGEYLYPVGQHMDHEFIMARVRG
ncbi:MAG: N-acetyltransferase family protein [Rickettsiales bacterium]